jgi:hypothetical protein
MARITYTGDDSPELSTVVYDTNALLTFSQSYFPDVGSAVPAHVLALTTLAFSLGMPVEMLVEGIEGAYRDLLAGQKEEAGGVSH